MRTAPAALRGNAPLNCRCSGAAGPGLVREEVAQRCFRQDGVHLDKGIEAGAGAAIRESDNSDVAHGGVLAQARSDHRRIVDQPRPAALAVGEVE